MQNTRQLTEQGRTTIMNTYSRFPMVLEKGEGCFVFDTEGKKYLDFVAGIAVNSLGHGHPALLSAISEQAQQFIHISNLYYNIPQITLSKKMAEHSCFDKVFFCNSGAEAVEGSLKLARKYARKHAAETQDEDVIQDAPFEIISMKNSFHGRTFGAVTATGQEKYQKGLSPMVPGIKHVEYNDFEALEKAVTDMTCAIIAEPIQGEGGIVAMDKEYAKKLRKLCDDKHIMLIFDEIQCGVGRTGTLFGYEQLGIEPDVACLAKGLAGGVPIGCLLAKLPFADGFEPGDHASTFGGNPLATAAANVVWDQLTQHNLLAHVVEMGKYLKNALTMVARKRPVIRSLRGVGLIQGIELDTAPADVINTCIENGLLLVGAGGNVIRFVPPLIVEKEHIDMMIEILDKALA